MGDSGSDNDVMSSIQALVAEEEQLIRQGVRTDGERDRLRRIEVSLDQCWDLLRQRRAAREMGKDPGEAHVRPPGVVEKYIG
jgi:hypothetical protein